MEPVQLLSCDTELIKGGLYLFPQHPEVVSWQLLPRLVCFSELSFSSDANSFTSRSVRLPFVAGQVG